MGVAMTMMSTLPSIAASHSKKKIHSVFQRKIQMINAA